MPYSQQTILAVVEFGPLQSNLSHLTFPTKLLIWECFQAATLVLDGNFWLLKTILNNGRC